jgi:indolepyruvate ferredoxin oxidoreductase beta subunit
LPFTRARFEDAIRRGGVGVDASLAAFDVGYRRASVTEVSDAVAAPGATKLGPALRELDGRIGKEFPPAVHDVLRAAIQRLADYQDVAYAAEYLDRLGGIGTLDAQHGDGSARLLRETARHLALWMSYEDTIRVADLKTRRRRFERVQREVRLGGTQLLHINEFLHPRVEEIADTLPAPLGRWLLATGWARQLVARFATEGRIVRTSSLRGFLLLYAVAALRRFRRSTLRFHEERQRIDAWRGSIERTAARDYELAVALAECQRLVKGYGDTHARGWRNFSAVTGALPRLLDRAGAAAALRRLRDAALADEDGRALQVELARLKTGEREDA